jgi:hypothetical protein
MKTIACSILSLAILAICYQAGAQPAAKAPDSPAATTMPAEGVAAVEKGKTFLMSRQQDDGSWADSPQGFPGGATALASWAMIENGLSDKDSRIAKALDILAALKAEKTYTVAIRANVWACPGCGGCGGDPKYKKRLQDDAQQLWESSIKGAHSYIVTSTCPATGDQSNSHYAVMGVQAGQSLGVKAPKEYWQSVAKHWMAVQNDDGGWPYSQQGTPSTATMTAAGVHAISMCMSNLDADGTMTKSRDRGLAWMDKNFAKSLKDPEMVHYYLLAVQRMAVATGRDKIGDVDWRQAVTKELLSRQKSDGSWEGPWGKDVATSYALLVLGTFVPSTQPGK